MTQFHVKGNAANRKATPQRQAAATAADSDRTRRLSSSQSAPLLSAAVAVVAAVVAVAAVAVVAVAD